MAEEERRKRREEEENDKYGFKAIWLGDLLLIDVDDECLKMSRGVRSAIVPKRTTISAERSVTGKITSGGETGSALGPLHSPSLKLVLIAPFQIL